MYGILSTETVEKGANLPLLWTSQSQKSFQRPLTTAVPLHPAEALPPGTSLRLALRAHHVAPKLNVWIRHFHSSVDVFLETNHKCYFGARIA